MRLAPLLLLVACDLSPAPRASPVPTAVATPAAAPAPAPAPLHRAPDPTLAGLQAQPLDYTHHARCRMDCRHIDERDVTHVLQEGTLEPSRTRNDGRCPSHAVEAHHGGRDLRVVFAGCETETRVVTVIDLDREWSCACD